MTDWAGRNFKASSRAPSGFQRPIDQLPLMRQMIRAVDGSIGFMTRKIVSSLLRARAKKASCSPR